MRSLAVGLIAISASVVVAGPAPAQVNPMRPNPYVAAQADSQDGGAGVQDAALPTYWSPIYNGFDHQVTRGEMRALHDKDLTRGQAREVNQLYDQLMSSRNQDLGR